jgi:predicted transcriptional regulator
LRRQKLAKGFPTWTLITSHGLVLLFVASNPDATIREMAASLDLTERRIASIVQDLAHEALVEVKRTGRRNHYTLTSEARFRHPIVAQVPFNAFVSLWKTSTSPPKGRRREVARQ